MAKALARSKKKSAKKTMKKKVTAKKMTKKTVKKAVKKVMAKKKMVRTMAKKVTKKLARKATVPGMVGTVVHYYDKIGVAVLELTAPVAIGEFLTFRRGDIEFTQPVVSLQIDREPVAKASKGQAVGMKVNTVADRGTVVTRA